MPAWSHFSSEAAQMFISNAITSCNTQMMQSFSFWILLIICRYSYLYLHRFRKEAMLDLFYSSLLPLLVIFFNPHNSHYDKSGPCHGTEQYRTWCASAAGASSPPDQRASRKARSVYGRSADIVPWQGPHRLSLIGEYDYVFALIVLSWCTSVAIVGTIDSPSFRIPRRHPSWLKTAAACGRALRR